MDKTGRGFQYLRNKFPKVSDAKIKEGIFIGPQIRELMQDKQFDEDLNETERNAWLSFEKILLRKSQISELSGCFSGPIDFVQSYVVQHKSKNPLFGVPLIFFFQKISAKSVTNMVKDFSQTFWVWKSGTKASGPQVR